MSLGRHVEINLKLIHTASGFKTYTFVCLVERLKKIVIMAWGSLTFSLSVFKEKSPYGVGRHVENVFYLKDFVTWQVCKTLSDISLGEGFFLRCFCNYHVGRHVDWLKKSSAWPFESILSVFFCFWHYFLEDVKKLTCFWVAVLATTTLGRHVENSLRIANMAFWCDVRWFIIESPVGRHVDSFKVVSWLRVKFPVSWAPCRECKPKKGINLSEKRLKSFLRDIPRLHLYSGPSVRKSIT